MVTASYSLSDADIRRSLKNITVDGYTSQIMVVLSTGPFLIAFALLLGANYLMIGLLAAIPPLVQIMQIPSVQLIEKIRNRRIITISSLFLYNFCIFSMALTPFFLSKNLG